MFKQAKLWLSGLFVTLLALAGCSSPAPAASSTASSAAAPIDGRAVIVYFSATGNTKEAAEEIARNTGFLLYELEPSEPYSEEDLDYNDPNSRVSKEHADEALQTITLNNASVPDWQSFDVVFLGYPIWWGNAAWPMDSFVKQTDFAGKTIYPFCTSASSPAGDSGSHLAELAGSGNWREAKRFSSAPSQPEVEEWLKSIGY